MIMKFGKDSNKNARVRSDNAAVYIGIYVLGSLEVFRIYFLLPLIYALGSAFIINSGSGYYRFFELFLFFMLLVLLLVAEVSKYLKNLFALNKKNQDTLTFNVCVNLILIFFIYIFLVYRYMDLILLYKSYPLQHCYYFGSSPVTDLFRVTIGALFIINIFFSFSYVYFNKKLSYEFYILLAFAYVFLLMCLICRNLFLLLILIEGLSLSLIGCICFARNKFAYEIALKFFILSAVFTVLGIFGTLLILMVAHTLDYRSLSFVSCFSLMGPINLFIGVEKIVLLLGVVLVISALLFKLGAFPFHAYVADFAAAAAYPMLFFFLGPLKLGIFFILILVYFMFFMFTEELNTIFLFAGLGSILIGAKGAVSENELKKFLGFTSINQIGFVIIGISVPGASAVVSAFIFFYIYLISNILFFYVPMQSFDKNNNEAFLYLNHFAYYSKLDGAKFCLENNFETNHNATFRQEKFIHQFRFIVLMFSFIGIPPLPGFGGKYLIFYNLIINHHVVIVFIVMFISLISAYYYLNLIYKLFNKNLTSSFIINYEFLKVYENFFCAGFHTFLFWAFILIGVLILDFYFFSKILLLFKNGL